MKRENLLGIDVSSKEAVVKIRRSGKRCSLATFKNDAAGHKKLIQWATKGGTTARVCVEATGVYSFELALALHQNRHTQVMVVNPRALKNFAQALMQRAKTDPIDAEVALEFLERMPFQAWQPPCNEILELQAISRRICQLKMELNRAGNRKHACLQRPSVCRVVINDLDVHIRLKAFYEHLLDKGKRPMQAVVAVMRKLLRTIWGMLKFDQDFEGEKFYKMA